VKAAKFAYEKPRDLGAALALLAGAGGDAKVIAGGQSLGPMLNLRLAQPALLVDVRGLPELAEVRDEGDRVFIGACTTHAAIEDGRVPDPTQGFLRKVARGIAYRAVRNRGTVGGSLAHADPAADWVSAMAVLDAGIVVRSQNGERVVPAADFVLGIMSTALGEGEILAGVRVPKLSPRARWSYWKYCRKTGEFAEAIGAFVVDPERNWWRGVMGATEGAPVVIPDARAFDPAAVAAEAHEPGTYEHQVHAVALQRAAAQLQAAA
jgi:carbon-monoxide dehydrogenase medium subunit